MRSERGAVTVEATIVITALIPVLFLVLSLIAGAVDYVRCVDAAREAARLAARGDPDLGRGAALDIAPSGAEVRIGWDGDEITVHITAHRLGVGLRATALAIAEPT